MAREFSGIFPYLVSPIGPDGGVLEAPLRELVEHLIGAGVHGLSPLGSTGEFAYLTTEQRTEIVRIVLDQTRGRVPVVPGVAAYSTSEAVRQATRFEGLGADGLIVILQSFFPLGPSSMESYFRAVAASVECPLVLYSNPRLLGYELALELIETLSEVPNIRYFKEASGNTGRILACLNRVGDRMKIFSASAHIPVLVLELGGVGWMAGPACIIPEHSVRLYDLYRAGRRAEAMQSQRQLWRFNELFEKYNLAACVKAGLALQGFAVGDPVAPQRPLGPDAVEEIRAALEAFQVEQVRTRR